MMVLLLQIAASLPPAPPPVATTIMDQARRMTAAEGRCVVDPDSTDITICGLRQADRFRVPFTGYDAGDRRGEAPMAERDRLMAGAALGCGQGAFAVGCGSVGMTVSSSRGVMTGGTRPLAR